MSTKITIDNSQSQALIDGTPVAPTMQLEALSNVSDVSYDALTTPVNHILTRIGGSYWGAKSNTYMPLSNQKAESIVASITRKSDIYGINSSFSSLNSEIASPPYYGVAKTQQKRTQFMTALSSMTNFVRKVANPIGSLKTVGDEFTTTSGGGVVLSSGNVIVLPRNASGQLKIYNHNARTLSSGTSIGIACVAGAVLANGQVLCVQATGAARVYNPDTTAVTTAVGTWPTSNSPFAALCCVTLSDGRIFLVPSNTSSTGTNGVAYIYSSANSTFTTTAAMTGLGTGTATFSGGVLLTDGRVFCVPYNTSTTGTTNRAYIYNPSTNTWSTTSAMTGLGAGTATFSGGVRLSDGRVFLVPYNTSTTGTTNKAYIWNPTNDTWATTSNSLTGVSTAYSGGVLLSDGKVLLVPYNSSSLSRRAAIYNPTANTWSYSYSYLALSSTAYQGALTLSDGKVFLIPNAVAATHIIDPSYGGTIDLTESNTSGVNSCYGCVIIPTTDYSGATYYKILMVPHTSTFGYVYDLLTNTLSKTWDTFPGTDAFRGGVLLKDGRVFLVPSNSTTARIYDVRYNTTTVPSGTYPGTGAFTGGVLLPDGRVFCVPGSSTTARIYDPVANTLTTPSGAYPGSSAFTGGVLLPDGRVFCVPSNSTSARIYDPVSNSVTTPSGTYAGSTAFACGVLLPDGRVFCVPRNSTSARIYDPVANTLTTPSGTYPGSNAFFGGVLLPDGRVFCIPFNSTTARIYDPITDTLTTPPNTYPGGGAYCGGVITDSGDVFMAPYNASAIRIYMNKFTAVPKSILCSPFLNKL